MAFGYVFRIGLWSACIAVSGAIGDWIRQRIVSQTGLVRDRLQSSESRQPRQQWCLTGRLKKTQEIRFKKCVSAQG